MTGLMPRLVIAFLVFGAMMTGQSAVPVEREPQHKPVFENLVVRLLDVVLPPGYVSLFHVHSNDNVSVRLATGPTRVDVPDADGQPSVPPVGRVVFNSATPPYTHRVVNVGTTPIHILDIEILAPRPVAPPPAPPASPRHALEIDNMRVRGHRVIVPAGESLAAHTHERAWLEVVVEGAGAGQYRWHEPGARVPAAVGPLEVVEIEVQ
jgi:hypothetical protein